MENSPYLDEFFSLKCAGDVINAVSSLTRAAKEITEAMAVVRHLKPFFLRHPMEYELHDIGAGNALASIIAVHLLPVKIAIAVDKKKRERRGYTNVKRFQYVEMTAREWEVEATIHRNDPIVVVAVHPCSYLATDIIDCFLGWKQKVGLVLMPCCNGHQDGKKIPTAFCSRISKYEAWAWWLAERAKGDLFIDKNVLSPCNAIIVAKN